MRRWLDEEESSAVRAGVFVTLSAAFLWLLLVYLKDLV